MNYLGRNMHNLRLNLCAGAHICVCGAEFDIKSLTENYILGNDRYPMKK